MLLTMQIRVCYGSTINRILTLITTSASFELSIIKQTPTKLAHWLFILKTFFFFSYMMFLLNIGNKPP